MRYTVLAVLSSVCLLVSCSESKDIFDVPHDGYTLFKANFEDIDLAGEKSSYVWKMEKGIGVFGSESGVNEKYVLKKACEGKAEGEFYGSRVSGDGIMAYYPYDEKFTLHDGYMTYTLPDRQIYSSDDTILGQFDKYAGYAYAFKDLENGLKFRYASGLLSIMMDLSETVTLTHILLSCSTKNLAGVGKLAEDMSLSFAAGGLNKVEVEFSDEALSKRNDTMTAFPVVLPAGTYHELTLVVKTAERNDIMVTLDSLDIVRVTADDFIVTEVVVGTDPLGGYGIVGGLEFDHMTTRDNTDALDKFVVVGGLELE